MKNIRSSKAFILLCAATPLVALAQNGPPQHYQETDLVSDTPHRAALTDPHLVNPWGLAHSATSFWWAADNGTGLSTVYNGTGAIQSLVVTVPSAPGVTTPAAPTGIAASASTTDFLVGTNMPAHFLFATEEGTISGWNSGTTAVLKVNTSGAASYKGLTLAQNGTANLLYAADFKGHKVAVYDKAFAAVDLGANAFKDPQVPSDYAPFNVQALDGMIYVTFAKTQPGELDEVQGPGRGYVSVFSPAGVLQKRLEWGSWFNAPWGVVHAPADFGGFSDMILVGQFGSGKIAAFDPVSGEFRGLMRTKTGRTLSIEGLWALGFGNDHNAGPANTLYFTAGIDDEAHGLFGTLTPISGEDDDQGEDNNSQK